VAKVKIAMLQHALSIAVVGIHALGGVPGLSVATTPAGEPSTRFVQYCVPRDHDLNFGRLYCRGIRPSHIHPKRKSVPRTCRPFRSRLSKWREHDRVPGVPPNAGFARGRPASPRPAALCCSMAASSLLSGQLYERPPSKRFGDHHGYAAALEHAARHSSFIRRE
jgi:hypothetical protein